MAQVTIFDTLSALMDCVCDALKEDRLDVADNWVGNCCVQFGREVAFDSCCEDGGQAWATTSGGYPTQIFPKGIPMQDWQENCSAYSQAMQVEVGAIRCVCFDQCDCTAKERNASLVYQDFTAALKGIICCFNNDPVCGGFGWTMQNWEIIGPEGGCGGFKINLLVNQPLPCC